MQWITLFIAVVGIGFIVIMDMYELITVAVLGVIFGMLFADLYRALKVRWSK
jgi:hypothetical protein